MSVFAFEVHADSENLTSSALRLLGDQNYVQAWELHVFILRNRTTEVMHGKLSKKLQNMKIKLYIEFIMAN